MARRSSLGPFPKTLRLVEVAARHGLSMKESDLLIDHVRCRLERLASDRQVLLAVTFLAALPIITRFPDPEHKLWDLFGIRYRDNLSETLRAALGIESATQRAAMSTLERFTARARFSQASISEDEWLAWRELDGSAFCELARQFFACLVEEYFLECLAAEPERDVIDLLAWELSLITQSFSARWFNKCAVGQVPDSGSIRWYLGHCLGKLDMELERELTTHVEPLPNPFRRRKHVEPPSLGLGL